MADGPGGLDDGLRRDMSVFFPQHAANPWGAASSILSVFCFVKPEDAEAFRDRLPAIH
jgi:hypothetical protein